MEHSHGSDGAHVWPILLSPRRAHKPRRWAPFSPSHKLTEGPERERDSLKVTQSISDRTGNQTFYLFPPQPASPQMSARTSWAGEARGEEEEQLDWRSQAWGQGLPVDLNFRKGLERPRPLGESLMVKLGAVPSLKPLPSLKRAPQAWWGALSISPVIPQKCHLLRLF